LRGNRKELEGI
jgi:hypothetical protein